MTTFFIIVYCVIAFFINYGTLEDWKKEKVLGVADAELLENEGILRFGVFLGSAFWPIPVTIALIKWARE